MGALIRTPRSMRVLKHQASSARAHHTPARPRARSSRPAGDHGGHDQDDPGRLLFRRRALLLRFRPLRRRRLLRPGASLALQIIISLHHYIIIIAHSHSVFARSTGVPRGGEAVLHPTIIYHDNSTSLYHYNSDYDPLGQVRVKALYQHALWNARRIVHLFHDEQRARVMRRKRARGRPRPCDGERSQRRVKLRRQIKLRRRTNIRRPSQALGPESARSLSFFRA